MQLKVCTSIKHCVSVHTKIGGGEGVGGWREGSKHLYYDKAKTYYIYTIYNNFQGVLKKYGLVFIDADMEMFLESDVKVFPELSSIGPFIRV